MFRAITAAIFLTLTALASPSHGQGLQARANEIRAAMDARDFSRAESLARALAASDSAAFTANNYDYLLARLAERRGANAEAQSLYLALVERRSILAQYALWRLSQIARRSNDLALERQYITRLLTGFPSSTLTRSARERMIESLHESGDYRSSVALLRPIASARGVLGRSAMARLGEAYSKIGDQAGSALGVRPVACQARAMITRSQPPQGLTRWTARRRPGPRSSKPCAARESICTTAIGLKRGRT